MQVLIVIFDVKFVGMYSFEKHFKYLPKIKFLVRVAISSNELSHWALNGRNNECL